MDCSMPHCLKWFIQQQPVWVLLSFLQKPHKTLMRLHNYSILLHITKHKDQSAV